jgi:hypothetical protein
MQEILRQLLSEEIEANNVNALKVINLVGQEELVIDDLLVFTDAAENFEILNEVFPSLLEDMIVSIPVSEFIKDIDFLLEHLFQGTGRKSISHRETLTEIKNNLDLLVKGEIYSDILNSCSKLLQIISSIKNTEFRLRLKFLFDKINTMIIIDEDSDEYNGSNDESNSNSSEYLEAT